MRENAGGLLGNVARVVFGKGSAMSTAPVRWISIKLLHNVIRTLNLLKERNGEAPPSIEYRSKVKLHGRNAAVQIKEDGIFPQSRSQLLSPGNDLKGFARWVLDSEDYWKSLPPMVVFGEWCGTGVQKKVALKEIGYKIFAVFALQIGWDEEAKILYDPQEIQSYLPEHPNLHVLPWYGRKLTLDFGGVIDEGTLEEINKWVRDVEDEDPWVKDVFGVSGRGEGLVFYPVGKDVKTDPDSLELLMFKAKGIKHQTNKTKKPAQVDPEVVRKAEDFAKLLVTESRLEQGVDEAVYGGYDIRQMGAFLQWIREDVKKESEAELETSGLSWKQVDKEVQNVAREWYKSKALC